MNDTHRNPIHKMNFIDHNKIRASNFLKYNTLFFSETFQNLPQKDLLLQVGGKNPSELHPNCGKLKRKQRKRAKIIEIKRKKKKAQLWLKDGTQ